MKSNFNRIPSLDIVKGGWRLSSKLVYQSRYLDREIIVPAGFKTDLASVPVIVPRVFVDVGNGPSRLPAIVHDYLCYTPVQKALGIKQRHADRVFREALETQGLGWFSRGVVLWLPTRIFQFFTSPFKKTGAPPIKEKSQRCENCKHWKFTEQRKTARIGECIAPITETFDHPFYIKHSSGLHCPHYEKKNSAREI